MGRLRNKYVLIWLLIAYITMFSVGCSSKEANTSATWLAVTTNSVKDKIKKYEAHRDNIAKFHQLTINSFDQGSHSLEVKTNALASFWVLPGEKKSLQKDVYDRIIAEMDSAHNRQLELIKLRAEHQEKVTKAKSAIASVSDKLTKTSKTLIALGKDKTLKDQLSFYYHYAKAVNKRVEELEKEAEEAQKEAKNEQDKSDDNATSDTQTPLIE